MNPPSVKLDYVELPVAQFAIWARSALPEIAPENVDTEIRYLAEHMAAELRISLRLPGEKSQRRLLVQYPSTWWDAVKARLGWRYKTTKVYQDETVVYPTLAIPKLAKAALVVVTNPIVYEGLDTVD